MDFKEEANYDYQIEMEERDIWIDDIYKVLRRLPVSESKEKAIDALVNIEKQGSPNKALKEAAERYRKVACVLLENERAAKPESCEDCKRRLGQTYCTEVLAILGLTEE